MVNSDIPAGTYAIRPKDGPQDRYLTIGPHTPVEPPPDALVDLGDARFPWVLKNTDTNTSTVRAKRYKWIIKDRVLFVSVVRDAVELNLERSDTGFVFIDNPGIISSRLTYHKDASPSQPIFTFQEADDSSAQLFEVIKIF